MASTTVDKPRPPALGVLNELSTGTYASYFRVLKELLSNTWDANTLWLRESSKQYFVIFVLATPISALPAD